MNTYLLIDITLIRGDCPLPSLVGDTRPSWVFPLYEEDAYAVTPLLIDFESAIVNGALDQVMVTWEACQPKLHASIIHSRLSLAQLVTHLQQFLFIETDAQEVFTFRYADCAVLNCLPDYLTPAQWLTMTEPISRWAIHGRDGKLKNLPLVKDNSEFSIIPLMLKKEQFNNLKDAFAADRLIYQLRSMRPTQMKRADGKDLHALATEVCSMWKISRNTDESLLLDFLLGAVDTEGRILRMLGMSEILAQSSVEIVRDELNKAISRNIFYEN